MHYEPSSPHAPPLLSQSPRAHTASASVHTGGDAQQTRVPTHSNHTRVHTTRSDSTRSGHTSSDQMRGATPRPTSVAPATHKVANRQRPTNPGVDQGPHLVQTHHPHVTKPQASRAHAREPHAAPDQPWAKSRSASQSEQTFSRQPHRATAPRKGKTSHIFCGNNILSPKLRRNGGDMEIIAVFSQRFWCRVLSRDCPGTSRRFPGRQLRPLQKIHRAAPLLRQRSSPGGGDSRDAFAVSVARLRSWLCAARQADLEGA